MRRIKAGEREERGCGAKSQRRDYGGGAPKLGSAEGEGDTFSIITFADAGRDKSSRYIAR